MQFLPSNPKTKKLILVGGVVGVALIAFVFFFISNYSSPDSSGLLDENVPVKGGVSEGLVERIGKNISDLREELQNDFYKGLRKHGWTPDNAKAGRTNPFLK